MLVVDPLKRITIAEIRKHQWFSAKLPKYLAYSPQNACNRAIQVNNNNNNINIINDIK